jgi:hypothetical protein
MILTVYGMQHLLHVILNLGILSESSAIWQAAGDVIKPIMTIVLGLYSRANSVLMTTNKIHM